VFTFTIPESETALSLMANSKFTGMLISGLAIALTQPRSAVSLTGMAFSRRRLLSPSGLAEMTVTLKNPALSRLHATQVKMEKQMRSRIESLEHAKENAIHHAERLKIGDDITIAQRRLDTLASSHRRKLSEQAIDTNYQVRVADAAAGNAILTLIAEGSAAAFAILGVISRGGSVEAVTEGDDSEPMSAVGLSKSPKIKDAAVSGKSLLGATAFMALFVLHTVHQLI